MTAVPDDLHDADDWRPIITLVVARIGALQSRRVGAPRRDGSPSYRHPPRGASPWRRDYRSLM